MIDLGKVRERELGRRNGRTWCQLCQQQLCARHGGGNPHSLPSWVRMGVDCKAPRTPTLSLSSSQDTKRVFKALPFYSTY